MSWKQFFSKKIKLPYVCSLILIIAVISCLSTAYIDRNVRTSYSPIPAKSASDVNAISESGCEYRIKRLSGFNYIHPLLFVDQECESGKFAPVKQQLNTLIDNLKATGILNTAAVYLRDMSSTEWMEINGNEEFDPGSLMKIPVLITMLKMSENIPGLLDRQITYDHHFNINKNPKYLSKEIEFGHSYSVRELLAYMIQYSDNNAALLLTERMDKNIWNKLFTDLGLAIAVWNVPNYPISAINYSLFIRVLYNSCYLTEQNSELATEMLLKADFKDGLVKGLPAKTTIAHKFGEAGNGAVSELHESGIIYLNNRDYLITVMTKGTDEKKLPDAVAQISSTVYQFMQDASL